MEYYSFKQNWINLYIPVPFGSIIGELFKMDKTLLIIAVLISGFVSAQSEKDSVIEQMELDTIIQFEEEGKLQSENCLLLKYSGDITPLINELISMHVQNPDVVQRTSSTLYIPQTSKPYWVYGKYDINVKWKNTKDYVLVEFWFYAYNRPGNYKIYGAAAAYQDIVNNLRNK